MLMKALVGTAKDLWQKRLIPAQVRAKDTRLAFAEIIVRTHEKRVCDCVVAGSRSMVCRTNPLLVAAPTTTTRNRVTRV